MRAPELPADVEKEIGIARSADPVPELDEARRICWQEVSSSTVANADDNTNARVISLTEHIHFH